MAHKTVTAYQSAAIFFSSVIAAAATFAISVIAAYFLSHSEFRQFQSAFWPLVFGIYGITGAIQQETTRAVGASLLQNPESRTHTNRLSYSAVAALLGLSIAAIVVMTSPLWSSAFPTYPQMSVVLIAFGVVMYAVYAAVSGASAGRDSWYFYAALGSGEALIRLAATLAAVVLSWHLLGFETAVVVASLIWVPCVVFSRTGRRVWHASIDVSSRRYARNIVMLMLSSAGASILMTAFPLFLTVHNAGSKRTVQCLGRCYWGYTFADYDAASGLSRGRHIGFLKAPRSPTARFSTPVSVGPGNRRFRRTACLSYRTFSL